MLKCQISWLSVQWELIVPCGRTDRHVTIVALKILEVMNITTGVSTNM
jgi:hypothetical protein